MSADFLVGFYRQGLKDNYITVPAGVVNVPISWQFATKYTPSVNGPAEYKMEEPEKHNIV